MDAGMSERRVGVFGGTFDPVHNGHLAIAEYVRRDLALDELLFVPAARPWMKSARAYASAEDRLAMIEMAIAERAGLRVSGVDVERPGPTYTVDTIRDLRRKLGSSAVLYFVVGADTLAEIDRWRDPDAIFRECRVVAVARRGHPSPAQLPPEHPGRSALSVDGPVVDVSATEIRQRICRGEPVDSMVPPEVERFIHERGLYRPEASAAEAGSRGTGEHK